MKAETAHLGDSKVRITIFQFQFVFEIDDAPFLTKDFFSVVEIVDFHFASRSFPLTEQKKEARTRTTRVEKRRFLTKIIYIFSIVCFGYIVHRCAWPAGIV